ncbi:MAG: hypothetical protein ACR2NM_01280 [Bythopirellula sp.]
MENYWSPGISGYGGEVNCRGVCNYNIGKGRAPIRGIVDVSVSNHVETMLWYYETICDPSRCCGFQNSVFRCHCGCCKCRQCNRADEGDSANDDNIRADTDNILPILEACLRDDHAVDPEVEASAGSRKR